MNKLLLRHYWTTIVELLTHLNFGIQETVLPEVCDPAHEVEHSVSHRDDGVRGECDRLRWNS